ncbi:MAG: hypothetical protein GYA46_04280 [candidate division Zixibacteria bacterium]|nr:hypothetical protein [candidate division Zixibacteria bacterium]
MRHIIGAILLVALALVAGCGTDKYAEPDPQQVVVKFLRAVEQDKRAELAHYLDLPAFVGPRLTDITMSDTVREFYNPEQILDDFSKGGLTYTRWMEMQRVVGKGEILGDSALVEVSFVSKETGKQYYNKWGLRRYDKSWKIYSFGMLPPEEE